MPWPSIFFKAKKPKPEPELPPPFIPAPTPMPEGEKRAPETPESTAKTTPLPRTGLMGDAPSIKPVPASSTPPGARSLPSVTQSTALKQTPIVMAPLSVPAPVPVKVEPPVTSTGTRTLPAMHGVVLRPPTKLATTTENLPNPVSPAPDAAPRATTPLKNIEQLMAEADPVKTLSQTGSIRMMKRLADETTPLPPHAAVKAEPIPSSAPPKPATPSPVSPIPPPAPVTPSSLDTPPPFPAFAPAMTTPMTKKSEPEAKPPVASSITQTTVFPDNDSPFILKPEETKPIPRIIPPQAPSSSIPLLSVFRRKAKMADVARIILPPKRDETEPEPVSPESSQTIVPPAFPVVAMTARAPKPAGESQNLAAANLEEESPFLQKAETLVTPSIQPEVPLFTEAKPVETPKPAETATDLFSMPPPEPPPFVASTPSLASEEKPPAPDFSTPPKIEPEAHKPDPKPGDPAPTTEMGPPAVTPEKREFHLANGERVAGIVLSETPEAVYLEHATLGVLTVPRAQIAKRLVEIILINGDRIVGDIMAETADTLYVRHASLGMLTVPRAQRSTRVVEAILKDGDRIVGEVLTETETATVIRSATLGTITVPHGKVAMLNRKVEQIELKALPPAAPELKDKPAG